MSGNLLLLGGDQVYPVASVREYDERFKHVFAAAADIGTLPAQRHVAAIPGNHDWYDGLVAFRRNFCESWITHDPAPPGLTSLEADERLDWLARWKTFQSRSYFAVKLPHDWWLWGIDIQLDAPMDAEQIDYFRRAERLLRDDDNARLILVTARPSWCDDPDKSDPVVLSSHQNLLWFVDRTLTGGAWRSRLRLVLTGDKHHYARYHPVDDLDADLSDTDNLEGAPEFVTCGGGGAYLSSTHHLPPHITPLSHPKGDPHLSDQPYARCREYPDARTSGRLRWLALATAVRNPSLVPFIGLLYGVFLTAWAAGMPANGRPFYARLPDRDDYHWDVPTLGRLADLLPLVAVGAALLGLLLAFAKQGAGGRRGRATLAGALHWLAHLAVLVVAADVAGDLAGSLVTNAATVSDLEILLRALLGAGGVLLLFGAAGGLVTGVYLFGCDWARLHDNESFASFRSEGYKSHLRIHVTATGLHVRVIGIDAVPKDWGVFGGAYRPFDNQRVVAREIDAFVIARGP